jgi:preprotein translocase subunit SecE
MARDRKRAKQRQQRRAQQRAAVPSQQIHRENVPGELDHASGDVDQVEAAIVAGADGQEAPVEDSAVDSPALDTAPQDEPLDEEEYGDDLLDEDELEDEAAAGGGGGDVRRPVAVGRGDRPAPEQRREGNAVLNFLRASWAELQRVQWPDRRQVAQATAVVLGFVAIAGAYLGIADYVFSEFVDAII